jgi:hypothetical protein
MKRTFVRFASCIASVNESKLAAKASDVEYFILRITVYGGNSAEQRVVNLYR